MNFRPYKAILCTLFALFSTITLLAQPPQGITFQGEARQADGKLLTNKAIEIKIIILEDAINGTTRWEAIHEINTDK